MRYYSTHGRLPAVTLEQAVLEGLAPDGGLYYPEQIPRFTSHELQEMVASPGRSGTTSGPLEGLVQLQQVAFAVLHKWFGEEIEENALRALVWDAQSFPVPIRQVGNFQVLELFHGPTLAFKDVAARHLARLMSHFLHRRDERALLLVATSGDTGGAIADGFADQENIRVVILYPRGKVSHLQEEQLTRVAANVTPVEVDGVFDDCQALVKQALNDPRLRHLNLTSANSINIARLLPQIIPYVFAHCSLPQASLEVVVPSGNFGNLTAALFAREMAVPLGGFIAATNENDTVARYYRSGEYQARATVRTLSNAMDVGNPSNFARIMELFGQEHSRFTRRLRAFSVNDQETIDTIQDVYERHGYLLCPHSAVAWQVAARWGNPALLPLVVATASPVKFAREIRRATGIEVDDSDALARLEGRPRRKVFIKPRAADLQAVLEQVGA
jgi:threonine synthase